METTANAAPGPRVSRIGALWQNAVGRKALMAVTGIVLFLFVFVHMIGNLQAFQGPEQLDHYAKLLRVSPGFLWFTRIVLLTAAAVHAWAGIQLWLERQAARPMAYQDYRPQASSVASRTMIWSGFLILGYVVYHLLDLTIGAANPDFREGEVFHNLVASLGRWMAGGFYVIAMIGLGFHLWHGLWSLFQSLGMSNRGLRPQIQKFAVAVAVILTLGFSAIPLAVLAGVIR
ncbi:MAG TPA: succinate dehydrogenase cytochrome b subunit [Anaeromyxobacteraceae bacterium]|nr:succinate dehydrogenase cytochrome b subunit [Anaeromyxobacteraceae bacterium]